VGQVAEGWYAYWDAHGRLHILEPGAKMPRSVLDIVGAYRTRAEAEAAAADRGVTPPAKAPSGKRTAAASVR